MFHTNNVIQITLIIKLSFRKCPFEIDVPTPEVYIAEYVVFTLFCGVQSNSDRYIWKECKWTRPSHPGNTQSSCTFRQTWNENTTQFDVDEKCPKTSLIKFRPKANENPSTGHTLCGIVILGSSLVDVGLWECMLDYSQRDVPKRMTLNEGYCTAENTAWVEVR